MDSSQEEPTPTAASKVQTYLNDLADRRNMPVVCIVGEINEEVAIRLWEYNLTGLKGHKKLSVLLHSYGGDPKAAYRMILALRADANEIEVLVPKEAKSAATLFCLGANDILIGHRGELGPLDIQIRDSGGDFNSALESFKASEQLLEHAVLGLRKTIPTAMAAIRFVRTRSELVGRRQIQQFTNAFVSNLYKDFDATELGRNSRYMAMMEEYAVRAMRRGGYEDEQQLRQLARRLVWEYPSHDFLIDVREAQEIGLKANLMTALDEVNYNVMQSLILEMDDVEDIDDLMDGTKDTFVGIGLPAASREQDNSDDAGDNGNGNAEVVQEESEG